MNNTRVALCCIAKTENDYIREYVEYYKNIGVNKIFINDNNDMDGERFDDVIDDYIQEGYVDVIDVRGIGQQQLPCYERVYNEHSDEFDWMMFFDCDEFLTLNDGVSNTVNEFLSKPIFEDTDIIVVNWKVYDDNEMLDTDGRPVLERLTHACEGEYANRNVLVKSIIKTKRKLRWTGTPHVPICKLRCMDAVGRNVPEISCCNTPVYEGAYLKHFYSKTIGEFCRVKLARGTYPDQPQSTAKYSLTLESFFLHNRRNQEKINYANSILRKE